MLLKYLQKLDLPRSDDLSDKISYQLTLLFAMVSLPILFVFPLWVSGCMFITASLKCWSIHKRFHVSRWLVVILFVAFVTMLVMNFFAFGKEYAAVALLLISASLKLLEAKGQRDAFLLMLIYFLLIMSGVMASQSPLVFVYLFVCLLSNLFIQIKISHPDTIKISLRQQLLSIGKIALLSMPFVIVLFFFFPRISPLWAHPSLPRSETGLSDEMSPDGLSELAQSGKLAFRVSFDGNKVPASRYLYWRGPVLVNFDGKTWRRFKPRTSPKSINANAKLRVATKSKYDYTIYQTGVTGKWILPLDMPSSAPQKTRWSLGYEIQSEYDIVKPTAFTLTSYIQYQLKGLSDKERVLYTKLPKNIYPKARQLAAKIKQSSKSDEEFIASIFKYFNENPYYYDLAPARGNDDIDTFLFKNKLGYCQHYSSAFTFMLRSVDIPARVVTGYQGGEINQISQDLEVKQLHAHAWVEVYLNDKGWVRYDPTSAVALDRINNGSPLGSARNTDLIDFSSRWESSSASYRWISENVRALSSFWQNWVINYDRDKQSSLWKRLGLGALSSIGWIFLMLALVPAVMVLVYYYRRYRQRYAGDVIWQHMQSFVSHLDKIGLVYPASVPLLEFIRSKESQQQLGVSQLVAEKIVLTYYRMRYSDDLGELSELKNAIIAFKKKRIERKKSIG